ncbi:MAG: exonuclease SbcCD subunit D [Actinomycetes bacterium]
MRFLHTADWHVGRTIRGRSRADEHRAVLSEVVGLAAEHDVDVVLVAGDVFDTATPGPESEDIVYRTLLDLTRTGARVVLLAGNHDNPRRLAAVRPLLDLTGVHVADTVRHPDDGGVLELETPNGTARVALVPFLSQRSIVKAQQLMELAADQQAGRYAARVRMVLDALAERFHPDTVNVVLAHLTLAASTPTVGDGERLSHVLDYVVPPQAMPVTAHYAALGHLHRPHRVEAPCPAWYSGSPLHLDFGEKRGEKSVLLVDAEPGVPATVTPLPLAAGRRLRTLTGTLEQLEAQVADVGDDHLRVVVREPAAVGLADTVRSLFPGAVDVRVARDDDARPTAERQVDVGGRPDELLGRYLQERDVADPALLELFRTLWDEATSTDDAGAA